MTAPPLSPRPRTRTRRRRGLLVGLSCLAMLGALVPSASASVYTRATALPAHLAPAQAGSRADASALQAFFNYTRPDTYTIHEARDILVPMRDGFRLTCDLYRPARQDGTLAPGRFPGIVLNFTSYGRTVYFAGNDIRHFAAKGYNTIWCNTRGAQGINGGSPAPDSVTQVHPWQPVEQQDNYDLIEWLAAQPWANGKIGQIGTSYGGISTLLVAGRQAPPSLEAIIPIEAVNDMYRQFVYPGGIQTVGDARGTWAQNCSMVTGEPTCSDRLPAEWAAHRTYDNYWQQQTSDLRNIRIPTLYIGGLRDFFLSSVDAAYPALGSRDDFALLLGPWDHGIPESASVSPLSQGVYLAWFDRWLRVNDNAPKAPKVMAYEMPADAASAGWRALSSWPPRDAAPMRLHLTPDGGLNRGQGPESGSSSYTVEGDGSSGALTYTTEPFQHDRVLAGPVDVTVTTSFTATDGNVIVHPYDVAPDGTTTSIGPAGYLKASHRSSDSNPEAVVPGRSYQLRINVPSKFWNIREGHQLRLVVTSADTIGAHDAPAGTVTVTAGKQASYVDLYLAA